MPSREGCRVFLGNLPYSVRDRDIERFFDRYGRVYNIFIKSGKYGFCEFDDYRDAEDAVYKLNGCELNGERITVEHARGSRRGGGGGGGGGGGYRGDRYRGSRGTGGGGRSKYGPPTRTNYRLLVENLSTRVSWQDLKDVMRRAGEVSFADAHNDRRNEGVVEFFSRRDMDKAIEKFDNYELQGRKIRLIRDRGSSWSRSPSRSRSRNRSSHSRSRSRSRSSSHSRSRSYDEGRKRRRSSRSRTPDSSKRRRRRRSSGDSPRRRRDRSSSAESGKDERSSSPPKENGRRSQTPPSARNGEETDGNRGKYDDRENGDREDDSKEDNAKSADSPKSMNYEQSRTTTPPPGDEGDPPPPGEND